MAVMRSVLNNDDVLFFPGSPKNKKKSRAFWVTKVENMPAHLDYKKGIDDPNREAINWLEGGEFKNNLTRIKNRGVIDLRKDKETNLFRVTDNKGSEYFSKFVILCTGVMDVQPEINGSIETIFPYSNVQLADYCLRCDGHHVYKKDLSILGHNNGAAWVAIMLYERYQCPKIDILTNGKKAEFSDETMTLIRQYKINVYEDRIVNIKGSAVQKELEGYFLNNGKFISSQITFISLGMIVYNDLAKMVGAQLDDRGFVLTDSKGLSSVDGLYVAGDLRANAKKQIYTAWDHSVDSADAINGLIRREKRRELTQ